MAKYIDLVALRASLVQFKTKADSAYLGKQEVAVAAKKLEKAVKINGVEFDGSQDIEITADPNAHQHAIDDVNGLQDALDAKLNIADFKIEGLVYENEQLVGVSDAKAAIDALIKMNVDADAEIEEIKAILGVQGVEADENGEGAVEATGLYKLIADEDARVLAEAKADAAQQIAALVDSAPEALDTLKELADSINEHQDAYSAYVEQVAAALAGKVDAVEGYGLSQNDFTDEHKAKLEAFQAAEDEDITGMIDDIWND